MNTNSLKRALAKGLHLFFIAALAAGMTLGVVPVHVAHAATFIVNSTADAVDANPGDGVCVTAAGECTLRAAIMESNALPGDDTISLPAGTYTLTIAGLNIASNLTVNGAGAVSTIIDGNGSVTSARVFDVGAVTVISGVTIRNGNTTGTGGGILNFGTLTLTNSIVVSNTATEGGGIHNFGTLTLTNRSIRNNTATDIGGIINNTGGVVMLVNSTVISNVATGFVTGAGGIYNSTFATMTFTQSIISNNASNNFGGSGIENFGTLPLTDSTVSGNTDGGAGISNEPGGTLALINSNVTSNVGGGIYNAAFATIISSTINSNTTTCCGGGIFNNDGTMTVANSAITGNVVTSGIFGGGGIFYQGSGVLTIINSTISENRANFHGGGIHSNAGNILGVINLYSVTIARNMTISGDGGGIYNAFGTTNFRNTIIGENSDNGGEAPDCSATELTSQGYNLTQNTSGCTIVGDTTGNLVGVDPLLGPLQDNGGPTFTHALLPGSPAIDAGNPAPPGSGGNACEAIDQRGVARPQGARCDIGAFEVEVTVPVNVNSDLSGRVKPGTSTFNPQPVSDAPAGTFSFTAEFCNIGDERLIFLKSVTAVLTEGSILLNRDSGTPSGVGSELTFAANREYMDLTLDGGECVDVPYVIGLARRAPFEFFVDILGVISDDTK